MKRIAAFAALGFGIVLLIIGGYLAWATYQSRATLERAGDDARTQVEQIDAQIQRVLSALTNEEFVAVAAPEGEGGADRTALIAKLRELEVRNVLNIVVASGAIERVDLDAFPGGGFAAMEMLLRAQADGDVPVQVHFASTPDEYLAAARRLRPDDVTSPVVLVTFPISVLANQIEVPDSIEGMRLLQSSGETTTVLDEFGAAMGDDDERLPIRDSLFQLGWQRPTVVRPLGTMQLVGVLGAGILAILLGLMLLRRADEPEQAAEPPSEQARDSADAPASEPPEPSEVGGQAGQFGVPLEAFASDDSDDDLDFADTPEPEAELPPDLDAVLGPELQPEPESEAEPEPEPEPEPPAPEQPARLAPAPEPPPESAPEAASDDLMADGEVRREQSDLRTLDAPELSDWLAPSGSDSESQSQSEPEAESKPKPKGDKNPPADDDLLFDPDAPLDDQGDLGMMLRSLVRDDDDDGDEDKTPEAKDASAEEPTPEPEAAPAFDLVVPAASIFRAYDIRGVVGDTLNADVATAIGVAIGSEARSRGLGRIAVARDGRLSGAELLAALSRGLASTGLEVIEVGAVPTPVLYYAAQEIGGGSGVMVTGSHNPPDYNGFKIVLGGETLSGDQIPALRARLESGDLQQGSGQISEQRIAVQYIERVSTDIQLEKPLKVVADCGNGIAGSIAPRLLQAIGAEVIPLYAEVDGTFPNHHPDPGDPATLEDLKLCVRNFNADLGVAFDGDGDRLGVVAPGGEVIYPDRLMMLFARDVLSRKPGESIIFDVKCSSLLAGEIEDAGGTPIMARTGHSFLKERLKREQAPLAGEMSGHFFFKERWFGFDDGIYAAARLLEILAADSRSASDILGGLPKAESTPELKVEMNEGEPHPFVETFQEQASFKGATVHTIDGVRAEFEDGFGLLRASNTTPVLVLRFEGRDEKALTRIQNQFREAMLAIKPDLKLPF